MGPFPVGSFLLPELIPELFPLQLFFLLDPFRGGISVPRPLQPVIPSFHPKRRRKRKNEVFRPVHGGSMLVLNFLGLTYLGGELCWVS